MAVFPGEDGLHDRKHVRAVPKGAIALEEAHKAPLLKDGSAVLQDGFPQCLVKLHELISCAGIRFQCPV